MSTAAPNIKFVAYLSASDSGSAQFRQHYNTLPEAHKSQIRILDYAEIKKVYADKCPTWLRGFPCIATYETSPTVWEGSKAIELVARWAAENKEQARGAGPSKRAPAESAVVDAIPGEFAQSSGDFGHACVVSDDLYQSHMPNKAGGEEVVSTGKITSRDIARYTSARESGQPRHSSAAYM